MLAGALARPVPRLLRGGGQKRVLARARVRFRGAPRRRARRDAPRSPEQGSEAAAARDALDALRPPGGPGRRDGRPRDGVGDVRVLGDRVRVDARSGLPLRGEQRGGSGGERDVVARRGRKRGTSQRTVNANASRSYSSKKASTLREERIVRPKTRRNERKPTERGASKGERKSHRFSGPGSRSTTRSSRRRTS